MSQESVAAVRRILDIHQASDGVIRPHFIITGPSGSGKSFTVAMLCKEMDIEFFEVNCAQLTKEGLSGASLSKVMSCIEGTGLKPVVVFMDEFDKLLVTGNTNSKTTDSVATEGVQNEMLKLLEAPTTRVIGDYGHYKELPCDHVLFVFAGAFNGEADIDLDRLRQIGVKTEFLGRVGLTFAMDKPTLEFMLHSVENQALLNHYLKLHPKVDKAEVVEAIRQAVTENYEQNTLGMRMITTLTHQYFIHGTLAKKTKAVTFQRELEMPDLFAKE